MSEDEIIQTPVPEVAAAPVEPEQVVAVEPLPAAPKRKARRERAKPVVAAEAAVEPVAIVEAAPELALEPAPAKVSAKAALKVSAKGAAKPAVTKPRKVVPRRVAPVASVKPKPMLKSKPTPAAARKPSAALRPKPTSSAISKLFPETFPMTTDFTAAFKTVFTEAQDKAKAAYEKGTTSFGEANAFAQGNVEALVESSKILAEGLQKFGTGLVAESREAFEGLTSEVKELTAVKSPTDFFKLQSDFVRKYFDSAVAFSSKQSEAMLKLGSEAAAPLSRRVSLAVETLKATA